MALEPVGAVVRLRAVFAVAAAVRVVAPTPLTLLRGDFFVALRPPSSEAEAAFMSSSISEETPAIPLGLWRSAVTFFGVACLVAVLVRVGRRRV